MAAEIFRFMTIRPPQEVGPGAITNTVDFGSTRSDFLGLLAQTRTSGSREDMKQIVQNFITNDNILIETRKKVDAKFVKFYDLIAFLEGPEFLQKATAIFNQVFGSSPSALVNGNEFEALVVKIANSLVAAAIDQDIKPRVRSLLVSLAKTVGFIQKLAGSPVENYSLQDFHGQIILMPEGIFPLPVKPQDFTKDAEREEKRRKMETKNQERLLEYAEELKKNRNAIQDIVEAFEKSTLRSIPTATGRNTAANRRDKPAGFMLPQPDADSLHEETKNVLKKIGMENTSIDIASAVSMIEKKSKGISNKLYASRSAMRYMVNLGNHYIPSDVFVSGEIFDTTTTAAYLGSPGPCPPIPATDVNEEVSIPLENTHGEAKVLGIGNLMIVEQHLLRYELGEIAHVENVLKSELRVRSFRTASSTERSTLTETEVTDEKIRDLVSTERFELQTESAKVIEENTNVSAGMEVSASYGPTVQVTANFNYTNSTSKQESNRASSNFARETTSRAASKVQQRTLERRFVKTVEEQEETNSHTFDNTKTGAENISGIYRFIDKIYHAQIVNYGKRLMLEFMVPEPAAFLRYSMTRQPAEGISQVKPEPPGYCNNNNFVGLQPQHLDGDNYLFWASKYLAEDIVPPPPATQTIGGSVINQAPGQKSQFSNDIYEASELKELKIPDGYRPLQAVVSGEGWNVAVANSHPATFSVQIQNQIFIIPNQSIIQVNLDQNITDKIPVAVVTKNYEKYAVLVNVLCSLTTEKFQEWQIKTYNSIMNAYSDLKTKYDNAILSAQLQAEENQVYGANPLINREREKTELKKSCINLLTAQNFETFDAMRRNVAPHGYPEIALDDAQAEGRYIQFFENAFEWVNMTYVFYPYFWGKKDEWVTSSQLSDNDPLYSRFLQAGAARVQVPVRRGFDTSIMHYLVFGKIWFGEGTLVNTEEGTMDPLHLSVLDELKEQLGNQNIEGVGKLAVNNDDTKVTGTETVFTKNDENRRISIRGKTYVIKKWISATEIELTTKFAGLTETDVSYSLGPKLVGEPWEVKLPTNLVIIDEHQAIADINEAIGDV